MTCDPKKIYSDLEVVGKLKVNSTSDLVGDVLCEGNLTVNGSVVHAAGLKHWIAGQDYSIYDERVYEFKLYVALQGSSGRTTNPLEDTEFWRQVGYLNLIPDPPSSSTDDIYYRLFREGTPVEVGVTVAFGNNSTGFFDRSYIDGFPSPISTFNTGTVFEFANGLVNNANVGGNLSDNNITGVRVSIANGNDNDPLAMKVAEWVGLINGSSAMNLRVEVNSLVDTSMDIFYRDSSIDIDRANIIVRTRNNNQIVIPNSFGVTIPANIPQRILTPINPTWSVDPIPEPSTSMGINQFIQVNDAKTAYEFVSASVTFADVLVGGTYGAAGTSTGGGALATLAVLYDSVQYFRIFAANGLSEILSTSTDETNTGAQIYTRQYEV